MLASSIAPFTERDSNTLQIACLFTEGLPLQKMVAGLVIIALRERQITGCKERLDAFYDHPSGLQTIKNRFEISLSLSQIAALIPEGQQSFRQLKLSVYRCRLRMEPCQSCTQVIIVRLN